MGTNHFITSQIHDQSLVFSSLITLSEAKWIIKFPMIFHFDLLNFVKSLHFFTDFIYFPSLMRDEKYKPSVRLVSKNSIANFPLMDDLVFLYRTRAIKGRSFYSKNII